MGNYYTLKDEWLSIKMGKSEYQLRHRNDSSINLDTWLVQQVSVNDTIVMYGTDIEGPIKQVGAADFIGGIHGDEKYWDIKIFVNGKEIDVHATAEKIDFDRIDIFVTSELFFCDSCNVAFKRYKHLLFAENRVIISNSMEYIGEEDFYVNKWPANGIFSMYKDIIYGYTTNRNCQLINDKGTLPDKTIDNVTFYGDNFCVTIRNLAEKNNSYLGWVHDYAHADRPRFKAYFDTLDNTNGDVVLKTGDVIIASYEIWII